MTTIVDFVDEGLGHSSYLIDLGNGAAAVIDPPRFPSEHEALAQSNRLSMAWTADTHSHADYVTGSPGLASRVGASRLTTGNNARSTHGRPAGRTRQRTRADPGGDTGPYP